MALKIMYKVEIIADDSGGEWVPNALRFPTKLAAEQYAVGLADRWTAVKQWRVVETIEGGDNERPN